MGLLVVNVVLTRLILLWYGFCDESSAPLVRVHWIPNPRDIVYFSVPSEDPLSPRAIKRFRSNIYDHFRVSRFFTVRSSFGEKRNSVGSPSYILVGARRARLIGRVQYYVTLVARVRK